MICFDSDYLHVELYETPNVLVTQWYGKCTSQQYREALLRFNDLVRQHNVQFVISDRRLLPTLSKADIDWTLNDYLPLFIKLPLKRFAVLNSFQDDPEKLLNRFLNDKDYPIPCETEVFDDLNSAYDWLVAVRA